MCYYVQVNFSIEIAKQRFGAIFDNEANFKSSNEFNGLLFLNYLLLLLKIKV